MAAAFDLRGGSKIRLMDDGREQALGATAAAAEEEDRISALPEALRLHILGLLPFKSAVRTGALSTQWRALWTHRWPAPSSLDLRIDTHALAPSILESLERRSQRRFDRFSFSFQIGIEPVNPDGVQRILDYAAACSVADLHVDSVHHTFTFVFKLRLPRGDPRLTRLTVGGIRIGLSKPFSPGSHTFSVLEVISLHGVTLSDYTVQSLVAASPLLRTLELCYCHGLEFVSVATAGAQLRSVTIAECRGVRDFSTMEAPSLRSFCYSGSYIRAIRIPATCALADIYICFGGPAGRGRGRPSTPLSVWFAWSAEVPRNWLQALTNLSNLTVLTLCSSALRRVSAKARARSLAKSAVPCLQNLRELQLLMFAMYNSSLGDIYVFIVACCPPLLERLFVQLPSNSHYYRPELEPLESEDELLESVEEDGPEEELSEEEDELPEGEALEEKQTEDAWSDEELSDEGQSEEEPVEDCLENLKLLKMTNFKGDDNEMNLVRFVLRNSTSLNQLLLFTSKSDQPEWLRNHVDTSDILEKILPLEKAWPKVKIVLVESDGDAIQPLHRKAFAHV